MLNSAIIVSQQSLDSDDSYDIIMSNIDNLNAAFNRYLDYDDVSVAALQSYHVDYYLAQIENGGFSQFVYNSGWDERMLTWIADGLNAMQAKRHALLFEKNVALLNQFSDEQLAQYVDGEYFGENQQREVLSRFDDAFDGLSQREDLVALNSQWLKQHPQLKVMDEAEIAAYLDQAASQIPNLEQRIAAAKLNQPRYLTVIEALCDAAGQVLDRVTMNDPWHKDETVLAWHFLTEQGHFYMLDFGDRAQMFKGADHQLIVEVDVSGFAVEGDE